MSADRPYDYDEDVARYIFVGLICFTVPSVLAVLFFFYRRRDVFPIKGRLPGLVLATNLVLLLLFISTPIKHVFNEYTCNAIYWQNAVFLTVIIALYVVRVIRLNFRFELTIAQLLEEELFDTGSPVVTQREKHDEATRDAKAAAAMGAIIQEDDAEEDEEDDDEEEEDEEDQGEEATLKDHMPAMRQGTDLTGWGGKVIEEATTDTYVESGALGAVSSLSLPSPASSKEKAPETTKKQGDPKTPRGGVAKSGVKSRSKSKGKVKGKGKGKNKSSSKKKAGAKTPRKANAEVSTSHVGVSTSRSKLKTPGGNVEDVKKNIEQYNVTSERLDRMIRLGSAEEKSTSAQSSTSNLFAHISSSSPKQRKEFAFQEDSVLGGSTGDSVIQPSSSGVNMLTLESTDGNIEAAASSELQRSELAARPLKPRHEWYLEHVYLMDPTYLVAFSVLVAAVVLVPFAVVISKDAPDTDDGDTPYCEDWSAGDDFLLVLMLCAIFVAVALAVNMREVVDGFGIKKELSWSAGLTLISILVWYIFNSVDDLSTGVFPFHLLAGMIQTFILLFCSAVVPLYRSYFAPPMLPTDRSSNLSSLEGVLSDKEARVAFRKQLVSEFSLENLVFYEDVEEYRQQVGYAMADLRSLRAAYSVRNDPHVAIDIKKMECQIYQMACDLFDRCVRDGSPYQVNLPHWLTNPLKDAIRFARGQLDEASRSNSIANSIPEPLLQGAGTVPTNTAVFMKRRHTKLLRVSLIRHGDASTAPRTLARVDSLSRKSVVEAANSALSSAAHSRNTSDVALPAVAVVPMTSSSEADADTDVHPADVGGAKQAQWKTQENNLSSGSFSTLASLSGVNLKDGKEAGSHTRVSNLAPAVEDEYSRTKREVPPLPNGRERTASQHQREKSWTEAPHGHALPMNSAAHSRVSSKEMTRIHRSSTWGRILDALKMPGDRADQVESVDLETQMKKTIKIDHSLFDDAQENILDLMRRDTFTRFCQSEAYRKLMQSSLESAMQKGLNRAFEDEVEFSRQGGPLSSLVNSRQASADPDCR